MGGVVNKGWLVALAVLLALIFGLSACGPLPRPFQPEQDAQPNPLVGEVVAKGILIEPIDGVSQPMSKLLTEALVKGFEAYGLRAFTGEGVIARYRLKGRAEINDKNPTLPYVVLIKWTLFNFQGEVIESETQGVSGSRQDWDYGSPKVIDDVGENGAEIFAALIGKDEEIETLGAKPVGPKLVGLWVKPIENAPGDGNASLTRAIKVAIKAAGIAVAPERRFAEFVLEGDVSLTTHDGKQQKVTIVWAVLTPEGREIGRATQQNLVETGTFKGPWGEVAPMVADAALEGIQGVLQAAGASRARLGPPARVLKTNVPKVEGQTNLPPPSLELEGLR